MPFRTTREADEDIIGIYLAGYRQFGRLHAERYIDGLAALFGLLAGNPRMARERTEFDPPVRLHPYHAHLIVYREEAGDVLIVRVLYGRQDWQALL